MVAPVSLPFTWLSRLSVRWTSSPSQYHSTMPPRAMQSSSRVAVTVWVAASRIAAPSTCEEILAVGGVSARAWIT
jgi:hypothetical protein